MSDFDSLFADVAAPNHVDLFGEAIVYAPHGGTPRTITAIVDRNPVALLATMQDVPSVGVLVGVLNDADNASLGGIDVASVNFGGDRVQLAIKPGGTAEYLALQSLVSSNGGLNVFLAH